MLLSKRSLLKAQISSLLSMVVMMAAMMAAAGALAQLSIATAAVPDGRVGAPYNVTLAASGGASPYTWSATGLPAGLTLNPSTGVISGTPTVTSGDSWSAMSLVGAPTARSGHTAVWTGSKMIVWGGYDVNNAVSSGGVYDPVANTWTATSLVNAPAARYAHTAVWTGSKMIVWGGEYGDNTGSVYDPVANTWTATNWVGAPSGIFGHSAIWTGSKMIVWRGGDDTGGVYDPVSNTWTSVNTAGSPGAIEWHSAVWTGSKMIVWGVYGAWQPESFDPVWMYFNSGAIYDPVANSWTAISTLGAPALGQTSAVWTGNKMIVWGGGDWGPLDTGSAYDPVTNTWTPTSLVGAPSARMYHTSVSTGTTMIVWGGNGGGTIGGAFDPVTNTWTATSTVGAPTQRYVHSAVWTGSKMIVWGGQWWDNGYNFLNNGGMYAPFAPQNIVVQVTDGFSGTDSATLPVTIFPELSIQTTSLAVGVVGEAYSGSVVAEGGDSDNYFWSVSPALPMGLSLNAATGEITGTPIGTAAGSHTFTLSDGILPVVTAQITLSILQPLVITTTTLPSSSVGYPYSTVVQSTGGALPQTWSATGLPNGMSINPATGVISGTASAPTPTGDGSWTATSMVGAPAPRAQSSAVWTGTRMIVWGGRIGPPNYDAYGDGFSYDPVTNSWTPISSVGATSAHALHTAVWTGSKMIVWGGFGTTGGVYDPALDSWTAMTTVGAPAGRFGHSAIWTGSKMIVWGGRSFAGLFNADSASYDPVTNTWAPISTVGQPADRAAHGAVWTGSKMLIWGGEDHNYSFQNSGGAYDPVTNTWSAFSMVGAPPASASPSIVWTGSRLIVWGGEVLNSTVNTGGVYDPVANVWSAVNATGAPSARSITSANSIWTGSKMLVWGGNGHNTGVANDGAFYDPVSNSWEPMGSLAAPSPRGYHLTIWTGSKMIVWGGADGIGGYLSGPLATGGVFDPTTPYTPPLSTTYSVSITVSDGVLPPTTKIIPFIITNFSSRDVNRDGSIDVVDVQLCVNLILALTTPTFANQGDVNGDNVVDVLDVQAIVNCILSAASCH